MYSRAKKRKKIILSSYSFIICYNYHHFHCDAAIVLVIFGFHLFLAMSQYNFTFLFEFVLQYQSNTTTTIERKFSYDGVYKKLKLTFCNRHVYNTTCALADRHTIGIAAAILFSIPISILGDYCTTHTHTHTRRHRA